MSYKWLLPQNQQVKNDFFAYRRYQTLVKYDDDDDDDDNDVEKLLLWYG